ncbi:hypothetical protein [Methanospirillum lacunae]|uniref:Uncharacterized protein n=1 Tax=Methanospirillum lacunae TaxID=668570 RepID=A0A2V2MXH7_9EURY|nr:hypothetical protein [Methanospirillum lacunae]PWR70940.1 hypothetical protein DK846_13210 [Methanospirillum lacunae]
MDETCLATDKKPESKSTIWRSFLSIFSYCPYTMLGKKILWSLQGKKTQSSESLKNRETYLKSKNTFGLGIILIGVFCPIFWISLLTGAEGEELIRSGINSLLVVLFGIFYIAYHHLQIRKKNKKTQFNEKVESWDL